MYIAVKYAILLTALKIIINNHVNCVCINFTYITSAINVKSYEIKKIPSMFNRPYFRNHFFFSFYFNAKSETGLKIN